MGNDESLEFVKVLQRECELVDKEEAKGIARQLMAFSARHQQFCSKILERELSAYEEASLHHLESEVTRMVALMTGTKGVRFLYDPRGTTISIQFQSGASNSLAGGWKIPADSYFEDTAIRLEDAAVGDKDVLMQKAIANLVEAISKTEDIRLLKGLYERCMTEYGELDDRGPAMAIEEAYVVQKEKLLFGEGSPAGERSLLLAIHGAGKYLPSEYAALNGLVTERFTSYEASGITFGKDGRFTTVEKDGKTVAKMEGRFSRMDLGKAIIENIKSSARVVGEYMAKHLAQLELPPGHVMYCNDGSRTMNIETCLRWIETTGTNHPFSFNIAPDPAAGVEKKDRIDVEIRVFLDRPAAHIFATKGHEFLGEGVDLVSNDERRFPKGDDYQSLTAQVLTTMREILGWKREMGLNAPEVGVKPKKRSPSTSMGM